MNDVVRVETTDGVAVVTVDNPPVNAMGDATLAGLEQAALQLADATDVRAVVLTGAGDKAFLAGADVAEFEQALGRRDWIEHHTSCTQRTLGLWEQLPQPVVAAVQATAVGGGLELALVCDLIVADPAARFGCPEVRLGLIPGAGGTQRLPRRVGLGAARELLLLGSTIDAEEAHRLGLANRISAPGDALAEARRIAAQLTALPALAVRSVKRAVAGALQNELAAGLDRERALFLETFASQDVREGVRAFLEKRAPNFVHS